MSDRRQMVRNAMGHVAEHHTDSPDDWWKTWLLRMGSALLAMLILGTALTWAWVGGLANPHARSVPIAVISGDAPAIGLLAINRDSNHLRISYYRTAALADTALNRRHVAAILASDQTGLASPTGQAAGLNLTLASGAGPGVASTIADSVTAAATVNAVPLTIEDVYPVATNDPDGRTPFYLMMAWILGGLMAAVIVGIALGTVPRDLDRLGLRIGALFVFSLALGLIGALFAGPILGVWGRHTVGLWLSGALITFTAALISSALQSWFGAWGIGIGALLLVALGVPGSGGIWGPPLLPDFFRTMHSWIPNGLATDLIRGVEYFGRGANTWPITGLGLWALASIAALVASTAVLGRPARMPYAITPVDVPAETAQGAETIEDSATKDPAQSSASMRENASSPG